MKEMQNLSPSLSRRRLLLQLSALGLLGPAGISGYIREALAKGDIPPVSAVHSLQGSVTVNGVSVKAGAPVKRGDRVVTAKASKGIVVIDGDAFLLRENTNVEFKPGSATLDAIQLVSGRLLSVFSKKRDTRRLQVRVPVGTIGIRGTGMYLEAVESRTYFCLCYGEAEVDGKNMQTQVVKTTHHESPLWLGENGDVMKVEAAPFLNHTDDELIMLEALCGREPPFIGLPYPLNKY